MMLRNLRFKISGFKIQRILHQRNSEIKIAMHFLLVGYSYLLAQQCVGNRLSVLCVFPYSSFFLLYTPDNTNAFLLGFYVPEDKPALKLTYEPDSHGFFHQLFTFWEKYRHCFTWKRQHYLKVKLHYHVLSISVLPSVSGWVVIRYYQFYMYVTQTP